MHVKEAVQTAITDVEGLFNSEGITNLGLEEVAFDESLEQWIVTVGFSRPWDYPDYSNIGAVAQMLSTQGIPRQPQRSFKIVRVRDVDGKVVSVKNYATGSID